MEREGEGRRGIERKKEPKRKKERKKTRLQPDKSRDCRIFRQGCYSYFNVQSERRYWSTKSWNHKGVYRVWWGHELTTHLWTSVNLADLGSYISLLGFLTNYFKTPFTRAQKIGTTRQIVGTVPRLPVRRLPPGGSLGTPPPKFWALVPHYIWDRYIYTSKIGSAVS